eukprot:4548457-Amphidinium_carterae.1
MFVSYHSFVLWLLCPVSGCAHNEEGVPTVALSIPPSRAMSEPQRWQTDSTDVAKDFCINLQ